MELDYFTQSAIEDLFNRQWILLEESGIKGAMDMQLRLRSLERDLFSWLRANANSKVEIVVEDSNGGKEGVTIVVSNRITNDLLAQCFKITINRFWSAFKVDQRSDSHPNVLTVVKTFNP